PPPTRPVVLTELPKSGGGYDDVGLTLTAQSGGVNGSATGAAFAFQGPPPSPSACPSPPPPGSKPLSVTLQTVSPDSAGVITICYTPPAQSQPPQTPEIDVVKATNTAHGTTFTASSGYNSQQPTIALSPQTPLAPPGSLISGQAEAVTLTTQQQYVAFKLTFSGGALPAAGTLVASCAEGNVTAAAAPKDCTTGPSGSIAMTYTAGSTSSGYDLLDASYPKPGAAPPSHVTTAYSYASVAKYSFSPNPIADPGTLSSDPKTLVLTSEGTGGPSAAVPYAPVRLSFSAAQTSGNSSNTSSVAVDPGSWWCPSSDGHPLPLPLPLSTTSQECLTDSSGHISMTYTIASAPLPTGGRDVLTVADQFSSVSSATDVYDLSPIQQYGVSPPIAAAASLGPHMLASATIQARNGDGTAAPGAPVYLKLIDAASGQDAPANGTASAGCGGTGGSTQLSPSFGVCNADSNGNITVAYTAHDTDNFPTNGTDAIVATDATTNPTVMVYDTYSYGRASSSYGFTPDPVARPGSLAAGATAATTLTAKDANGTPVQGETEYLLFSGRGAAFATCPQFSLVPVAVPTDTINPLACATGSDGTIPISYTAPQKLPAAGTDSVTVWNKASAPTLTKSVTYSFAPPTAASFGFSPGDPIAPDTTLAAGTQVPVTLAAFDLSGNAFASTPIYLSFVKASGGGSATATCAGSSTALVLSTTAQACTTDPDGKVPIAYSTPAHLPASGIDSIVAASDASAPPATSLSDTYSYAPTLHSYVFAPNPVAAGGTLKPTASVAVTLTAEDGGNHGLAGTAFLSLNPTTGGGSATASCSGSTLTLSATPQACATSAAGTVPVTYTAPQTLPVAGTDTINVADAATTPSRRATDAYSFAPTFTFTRLAGGDRFATAATIADAAFPNGATSAILVTAFNFPDALSAGYLAGVTPGGAPILLVGAHVPIAGATLAALHALKAHDVTIVGGPAAVGVDVAGALASDGYRVTRVSGATRYDTMAAVGTVQPSGVGKVGGKPTAILATGQNFPDALSAGSLAYAEHFPLVLTDGAQPTLSGQAKAVLDADHITHLIVVGGKLAISPSQYQKLPGISIDIAATTGPNRAGTAQLLADDGIANLGLSKATFDVANGLNPQDNGTPPGFTPDALAGAPLAGRRLAPILVTLRPDDPGAAVRFASEHASTERTTGFALGGPVALAPTALAAIAAAAGGGYSGN
ncbi:MAG: cell wall-binding repeat-containing protein, partial [Acidimicrobiales bacterium]